MDLINIGGFTLNKGKTFIIAELSANHGGSLKTAIQTVVAAKKAGADAIKLQTYTPDTMTIISDRPEFTISSGTIWDGKTYHDLYKSAYTPWQWHEQLKKAADDEGIILFSSPFDTTAVDFLETQNVPAYKIASFEITDIPLIKYTAKKGKPMIISTGIADYNDIAEAVTACRDVGNNNIILLKCTSAYPAPANEANLKLIPVIARDFNVLSGLSDHTEGFVVPLTAVSLGATIIEKHFILDKSIDSPDATFSMAPDEFSLMVKNIRIAESSLGSGDYTLTPSSVKGREFARSLYAVEDINEGEVIGSERIRSIRPSKGLHPRYFDLVAESPALRKIKKGEPLTMDMIKKD